MPQAKCQHCNELLSDYPSVCPYCNRPILGATAIDFLGQSLSVYLNGCVDCSSPHLAKKRTAIYLKICQNFLCESELALLRVKCYRGEMDEKTLEAIEDVVISHYRHVKNLQTVLDIIGQFPELEPVLKKVTTTTKRIDLLLKAWTADNIGGRTLKRSE